MEEKDLEKERDEYLDGWKRAKADFINYKKDEGERMSQIAEYVRRELLIRVLPILDSLARAEREIPESQKEDMVCKGFLQIGAQWREFLKQQGVQEIETVGKPFNPELHEAVGEADPSTGSLQGPEGPSGPRTAGQEESGMIIEESEKGYTIHGKLLRPAKVKITK